MQLMQIIHLKVPVYEPAFYKNFLIPCLNLEAAILETDKVKLHQCDQVFENRHIWSHWMAQRMKESKISKVAIIKLFFG